MTETALAIKDDVKLSVADIKKYIAPNASDKELFMFMGIAKSYGLNPLKREIHFVKYGDNPGQSIVGYEIYIKRAERTGKLDGWKVWVEKDSIGDKAVIEIYRKDFKQPFRWEVYRNEFDKKKSTWAAMPTFMLKKVAIAQGFRLAFPDELGGMPYIPEEMPTDKGGSVTSEQLDKDVIDAEFANSESPAPEEKQEAEIKASLKKQLSDMMTKKGIRSKERKIEFFTKVVGGNPSIDSLQAFLDNFDDNLVKFLETQEAA